VGSTLTCQGLSTAYNTNFHVWNGTGGLVIESETDIFSVTGNKQFPFSTGDMVYYGSIFSNQTSVFLYYAIRISETEIKLATTYENAIAGIPLNITFNSPSTNNSYFQYQIGSSPLALLHGGPSLWSASVINPSFWQSRSFSTTTFSITENISFECNLNQACLVGISTVSGSYRIGGGTQKSPGPSFIMRSTIGDVRGLLNLPVSQLKITVLNKSILFSRLSGGSYITFHTTTPLTTQEPLRFYACLGTNNTGLTNCKITYL
jgi:hypothetical protein